MASKVKPVVNCAKCTMSVCSHAEYMKGPDNCPTRTQAGIVKSSMERYHSPELSEFARVAAVTEGSSYIRVPWSDTASPITTRLEETIRFASMMGYKKLGVAFCGGLANEAEILIPILENAGFNVISVCCKVGGVAKEEIGVKDSQKINPGKYESMCNPITQAEILNKEKCDFNIMMGLCVGHDSMFLKYALAPTTVFAVKDRVLGHNPLMVLYLSRSFYRRVRSPKLGKRMLK